MKQQRLRFWIILLTFAILLSCGRPDPLPTVAPTTAPEATAAPEATPVAAPEESTPVPAETEKIPVAPDTEKVPTPSGGDDREIRQHLLRATVQILALEKYKGRFEPMWTGSGTILTPEGLILTNAHVVTDPDPDYRPDALGVAITVRSDDLPELKYLAEALVVDTTLDLAVIQIVSDLSGDPVDVEALNLDYISLGDSDSLELGDLIHILGYPGIGGETITFTEGVVSGFTREPGVDGRAYVKTDATIAGGNSGGLAANLEGEIIGVPTQVGYGGAERFADCRYLADTNGDGDIDQNDNCIPVGGFINAVRPINLAKPLVEAARLGIQPSTDKPKPGKPTGDSEASFTNLVFAPAVDDRDQPTSIVTQLPSGATELYACWEYAGMGDTLTWEARWYRDGAYNEEVSWTPALWKGGEEGTWWVSVYNEDGLTEGLYRLELYVEGRKFVEGEIQVGGDVSGPAITNLVFSADITDDDQPVEPATILPSGIDTVYAFFNFSGMSDGATWSRFWYYEGEEVASREASWDEGSDGATWLSLGSDEPLTPGEYRLELYVEGVLLAAGNFIVAGDQSQEAIGPILFAAGIDDEGEPVDPGETFSSGTDELHFFVEYNGMQDGLSFDERWLFDGEELLTVNVTWDQGDRGTFSDYIYRKNGEPLWEGEYTLELYLEGELVQSATTTIGGGEVPPTPVPTPGEGLQIQGYILDADTERGIEGALYVVLAPGVTVDDWEGDEEDIYTAGVTDEDGYFELGGLLERGESYSIIVWAEGYEPVTGDNIEIGDEESPLEVEILLQKE